MARRPDDDSSLLTLLEQGVKDVLADAKATKPQKLKAIEAGCKVLMIKRKLTGDEDGNGSFFPDR